MAPFSMSSMVVDLVNGAHGTWKIMEMVGLTLVSYPCVYLLDLCRGGMVRLFINMVQFCVGRLT